MYRIGVDIGGTFTDLVAHDSASGDIHQVKSLTTPDAVECVSSCLEKAASHVGRDLRSFLGDVDRVFCLGSTTGINTLLTRSGARVGILTTRGHGDAYRIARMRRAGAADIRGSALETFQPLVPWARIAEVDERVGPDGEVLLPLDEEQCRQRIRALVEEEGADALAIGFLWSQKRPAHERRAQEIAAELYPDLFVSASAELSGQLGEFSRLATAVVNSYVGRASREQVERLNEHLGQLGLEAPILVMQTLGGVVPLREAMRKPVSLLKSAAAGGTVASAGLAKQVGEDDVVCMDMGGTSLDVSLVTYGEMQISTDISVAGHPLALPGVEVSSVGAGGGSIARYEQVGSVGRLRVGPESASSRPGPACYGLGGEEATVTDANVVLGLVGPETRFGGELALRPELSRQALAERLAARLDWREVEAAWGVYQVIAAEMADAIENLMITKGLDPRRYAAMAFGAAGPCHAAGVAALLGIEKVIVPPFFPVFSALGLMMTDIRHAYNRTDDSVKVPVDYGAEALEEEAATASALLEQAAAVPLSLLEEEGVPAEQRGLRLALDMRYAGQLLELDVELDADAAAGGLDGPKLKRALDAWTEKYRSVYGEGAVWSEGTIEIFNYRAIAVGRIESPELRPPRRAADAPAAGGSREIYLGEPLDARVISLQEAIAAGELQGPMLIEDELGTIVLGHGDRAGADPTGSITIRPDRERWISVLRRRAASTTPTRTEAIA